MNGRGIQPRGVRPHGTDPLQDDEQDRTTKDLLARYANTRLAPGRNQLTRMRAQLVQSYVGRAWRDEPAPRRGIARTWRWAFAAATVLALTLGSSFAAAESGPGQPFYHVRLSLESLTVPGQGSARVEALLAQLDARLAEARQASQRGDHAAVADAVTAYEQTLEALSATADATGSDQFVLDQLAQHETVLQDLLGQVPAQGQAGLQHALQQTQHARDAIGQRPATPGRAPTNPRGSGESPTTTP